ncbi:MAG: DMT family transporter [Acidobacteriaceae bacterium]|nr:DMT family transporter [Acidobacteriaceae bacterium]
MSILEAETEIKRSPARWQAEGSLVLVALAWGTTFVAVKRVLVDVSTIYFLTLRFALASACMLLMFAAAFRRSGARAVWRGLRGGAIVGVFLWLGYVLQTFGLKYTSAGNSGFLTGLYIILVPLIGAAMYRRWPQIPELAGLAVASVGIVLITLPSMNGKITALAHMNRGDALTIGCAVAFAVSVLLLGHYSKLQCFEAVAVGQIACVAVLSAISLVFEPPRAVWSGGVVAAVVSLAVFATAFSFALQTWGQRYTSATRAALIYALEPVFALLTAVLAGGERVTVPGMFGAALILAGILTVELKPAARA